jgi:hypothetical protein
LFCSNAHMQVRKANEQNAAPRAAEERGLAAPARKRELDCSEVLRMTRQTQGCKRYKYTFCAVASNIQIIFFLPVLDRYDCCCERLALTADLNPQPHLRSRNKCWRGACFTTVYMVIRLRTPPDRLGCVITGQSVFHLVLQSWHQVQKAVLQVPLHSTFRHVDNGLLRLSLSMRQSLLRFHCNCESSYCAIL